MTTSTDTSAANLAAVQDIYEAFGRGDVETILGHLAPDAEWDAFPEPTYAQRAGVPWLARRQGPAEIADFFRVLSEWQVHDFQVLSLTASGDRVVAEIRVDATTAQGGRLVEEEVHMWVLGADGRATSYRHYADTAKHEAAFRGQDTRP